MTYGVAPVSGLSQSALDSIIESLIANEDFIEAVGGSEVIVSTGSETVVSGLAGDGLVDDTAILQAAINDASVNHRDVVIPAGTHRITGAGLTMASGVTLRGVGMEKTRLVCYDMDADSAAITVTGADRAVLRDFTIDGRALANLENGIKFVENVSDPQGILVERVRVEDVRHPTVPSTDYRGIWAWKMRGITVRACEFSDCNVGVYCDEPGPDASVIECLVESPAEVMINGIQTSSFAAMSSGMLIANNVVRDAMVDPSDFGVQGQGIILYNTRNVRVEGNDCSNCNTSGILVGVGASGAMVIGNHCHENQGEQVGLEAGEAGRGTGIYIEHEAVHTTVQTDRPGGCIVEGNVCWGNYTGIACSYSPTTTIVNNVLHSNKNAGTQIDSDKCVVIGNVVYSNNTDTAWAPSWGVSPGGIMALGAGNVVAMNVCFDNQTVKTQDYGLVMAANNNSMVFGNVLDGNQTGARESSGSGSSNSILFNLGDKPTITGSRGSNAALASLLTELAARRIIVDSSS